MQQPINKRRHFIKAGLATPLLSALPWSRAVAGTSDNGGLNVPDDIKAELVSLYGDEANYIEHTDKLKITAPAIAENGAVVPIKANVEANTVSSLAILVAQNPHPLACTSTFHEGSDLHVATRVKIGQTSDIYVVAQTEAGLIGVQGQVKVTIGCGGG